MKHKLTAVCLPLAALLWAFFALSGCGKANRDVSATLDRAEKLMNEYPDSAYRMLRDMKGKAESLPTALRMKHLLLLGNAQNKADILFTSDSLGKTLAEYYRDHGTTNERMLAHYVQGCAYRDMKEWPSAVRCFNDAVAAADTASADCDSLQLSIIYGQLGYLYDVQYLLEESLKAYRNAERYAPDTFVVLNLRDHISNILFRKGDIQQGLEIKDSIIRSSRARGDYQSAAIFKVKCIKWYARQGDFAKAAEAMTDYERNSGFFLSNGDIEPGRQDYYYIKGVFFEEKGNMDSAEHYFRKLQRLATNVNSQYLASFGLTRVYRNRHMEDSVAKYAWQTFQSYDSLYNSEVAQNLQQAQARYNYDRHQQLAHKKEMEAKVSRIWLQNVILICTVLLSMIVMFVMVYRRRVQGRMLNLQQKVRLQQAHHAAVIETLKGEIEEKTQAISELNERLNENIANRRESEQMARTIFILEQQIEKHRQDIEHARAFLEQSDERIRQSIEAQQADSARSAASMNKVLKRNFKQVEETLNTWQARYKGPESHLRVIDAGLRDYLGDFCGSRKADRNLERLVNECYNGAMEHLRREITLPSEDHYRLACQLLAGMSVNLIASISGETPNAIYKRRDKIREMVRATDSDYRHVYGLI